MGPTLSPTLSMEVWPKTGQEGEGFVSLLGPDVENSIPVETLLVLVEFIGFESRTGVLWFDPCWCGAPQRLSKLLLAYVITMITWCIA